VYCQVLRDVRGDVTSFGALKSGYVNAANM
jgi:hypothetical protein